MKARFILVLALLLLAGCASVTEEEAISIAKEFVNENVRFHSEGNVVEQASITIISVYKENNEWLVKLHIQSNVGGEIKKSGLVVAIDSKTGEVLKDKLQPFKIDS